MAYSESDVRDLVRRVVDEVGDAGDTEPAAGGGESVAVGADHGGFGLKQKLVAHLRERGYTVQDCGTDGPSSVDYPEFAHEVARRVASGACRWGVIVDGAGIGSCMVANKVPGVRAALCYDLSSASNSREHNHANVLTLGAGLVGENLARQILDVWLETPWGADRHARRVEMIDRIEASYSIRQPAMEPR